MSLRTSRRRQRVNYDLIAHLYDEPLRDHSVDQRLISFLDEHPALQDSGLRILDMGCGMGTPLTADRREFVAPLMVGLDRFGGMLRQARRRDTTIRWIQADSARLPFRESTFD